LDATRFLFPPKRKGDDRHIPLVLLSMLNYLIPFAS
jgi:hypothetical protein